MVSGGAQRAFSVPEKTKKVRRLLVGRSPGRLRTFVVDDARRAVAAVVRAFDERDHRV